MSQTELETAVAAVTGETLRTVRRRGFTLLRPHNFVDLEPDDMGEPQVVDWDRVESARRG